MKCYPPSTYSNISYYPTTADRMIKFIDSIPFFCYIICYQLHTTSCATGAVRYDCILAYPHGIPCAVVCCMQTFHNVVVRIELTFTVRLPIFGSMPLAGYPRRAHQSTTLQNKRFAYCKQRLPNGCQLARLLIQGSMPHVTRSG